MPKLPHEAMVQLIRAAPAMVVELVNSLLGGPPGAGPVTLSQVTAAELVNLDLPEFRADAVILVGEPKAPVEGFVVEAQGEPSARKRKVWPYYVTGFAVRFDCPVTLVVFALRDEVADWCAEPIDFGRGRGWLYPLVIRSRDIPRVTDPEAAVAAPELAVLSVMAHGREPGAEHIAKAALMACGGLDSQAGVHYADFVHAFLGQLARAALRQIMQVDPNWFMAEELRWRWDEGRYEAKAEVLLRQFRKRGWTVTPDVERQVMFCHDEALFEKWTDRVLTAATLDEVLAD